MKRIAMILLSLALILSASACTSQEMAQIPNEIPAAESTTEEKAQTPAPTPVVPNPKTEESTIRYPEVVDPLTPEKLAEIPIANDSMSEDQLRQICLDYFHLQLTFSWTPDTNYSYTIESSGKKVTLTTGTVYGGIPYVTVGTGNLYRILESYDTETGIMDVSNHTKNPILFGNQCSVGAFWGWGRVVNSANYTWTASMTQKNGFLRVGPYTYDDELTSFATSGGTPTKDIIAANTREDMYASYAQLKPADGVVTYSGTAGHVRMIDSEPTIVYDAEGKIDGMNSYLTYQDQQSKFYNRKQSDGSPKSVQGGVKVKVTFQKLYAGGYLPFTFAELIGTDPVEKASASFSVPSGDVTVSALKEGSVTTNYAISDVFVVVYDKSGTEKDRFVKRSTRASVMQVNLNDTVHVASLSPYLDGNYKVEVSCQLSTGEKLTVFSGTLIGE